MTFIPNGLWKNWKNHVPDHRPVLVNKEWKPSLFGGDRKITPWPVPSSPRHDANSTLESIEVPCYDDWQVVHKWMTNTHRAICCTKIKLPPNFQSFSCVNPALPKFLCDWIPLPSPGQIWSKPTIHHHVWGWIFSYTSYLCQKNKPSKLGFPDP